MRLAKNESQSSSSRGSATAYFAAFLRGIAPTNASMPELKRAFESVGFTDVKTVLASGNVVFASKLKPEVELEQTIEAGLQRELGRTFLTMVRPMEWLRSLLRTDPWRTFDLAPRAKRVVTFLRSEPSTVLRVPLERDDVRILRVCGREVFTAYVPSERGPTFMSLLEKTFGKEATTRTWETLTKVAR